MLCCASLILPHRFFHVELCCIALFWTVLHRAAVWQCLGSLLTKESHSGFCIQPDLSLIWLELL